jgi:hypothetical protein
MSTVLAVPVMAPYRAGIVPVVCVNGVDRFGYGIDAEYKTLIDLAGHIDPEDVDYASTAFREFTEETLGAFSGLVNLDSVRLRRMVYDADTVNFLYRLPPTTDITLIHRTFHRHLANETSPEVLDLRWLTHDELLSLDSSQIYSKSMTVIPLFVE